MSLAITIPATVILGALCLFVLLGAKRQGIVPLCFFLAGVGCTVLRIAVMNTSVDPANGFYIETPVLTVFNVCIVAVLAALCLLFFFTRKRSVYRPAGLRVPSDLTALFGAVGFAFAVQYCLSQLFQAPKINIATAGMLFCAFVSLFTLLMTLATFERKLSPEASLAFLGPVLFSAIHLISSFIEHITLASVSEYLYDVGMLIFVLLFFFYDAKCRLTGGGHAGILRALALGASIFTMVVCLPKLYFSGSSAAVFTEAFTPLYACYLFLLPYFLRRSCAVATGPARAAGSAETPPATDA